MSQPKKEPVKKIFTSAEKFTDEFHTLNLAAVGVTIVRTSEPFRAIDALRLYCLRKSYQLKLWKCTEGMLEFPLDASPDKKEPKVNTALIALPDAVRHIGAEELPKDAAGAERTTVYALLWPQDLVDKNQVLPELRMYLAEYAKAFAETEKRVLLIAPPGYSLPSELQDAIPMVHMDTPTQPELLDEFERLRKTVKQHGKEIPFNEEDTNRIISAGAGMTQLEFSNTISRGIMHFNSRWPEVSTQEFLTLVSEVKAEIIQRGEVLELMSVGTMADIGGLNALKKWIQLQKCTFEPEAAAFGVDKAKGCALFGVPGTGKSVAAKAIAYELGTPLLKLDVGKVFDSLVGSSEARLREALLMVRRMAPVTIMIDEIDKVFMASASSGDSGVGKRILGTLLTFMQEAPEPIFWVFTGNRVNDLPTELTRKGRLDEVFCVTVPNDDERAEILNIHLRKRKKDPAKIKGLQKAVEASKGYVGSEMEACIHQANLKAFSTRTELTGEMIAAELVRTKPMSVTHAADFNAMREWAETNAVPASDGTPPAPNATTRSRTRTSGVDAISGKDRKFRADSD